jgi:hypothetical protein
MVPKTTMIILVIVTLKDSKLWAIAVTRVYMTTELVSIVEVSLRPSQFDQNCRRLSEILE